MKPMTLQDYLNELSAAVERRGREWSIVRLHGEPAVEPMLFDTRRELVAFLDDIFACKC